MPATILLSIGLVLLAYLLGSIPTAVWVSRAQFGKDIRTVGSGNAGSTNTYRAFGFRAGLLVQVVDILKGSVAVLIPLLLEQPTNLLYICGLAAVLGHIYPVLAGFKGGKGMNTLLGAMLVINPAASGLAVLVFGLVLFLGSMVSVASIVAVVTLPAFLLIRQALGGPTPGTMELALAVLFPLLVVFTHRTNVGRILKGTESRVRFGLNKPPKTTPTSAV